MTDGELLSKYADEACEESFRRLVERYLSLVQGVAVRKTGRPDAAEDIAMQVFAQAARKARALSRRDSLGGWFVLATRLAAAQAVRREHSRSRVMEKTAQQSAVQHEDDSSHSSSGIFPWLDDALARLSERERDTVVLHFYNGMSFREIGRREGRGEDASRKRVGLALGKMCRFFQRRGVTLSITTVSSALASEWVRSQSTLTTTAGVVTQKALALASSLSLSQVAGFSLTAIGVAKNLVTAALIALCLVPLIRQHQELSSTRDRIEALEKSARPLFRERPPVAVVARKLPEPPAVAPATKELDAEIDLTALAGDFLAAKEGDFAARRRIRSILEPLEAAKLLSLLESAATHSFPKDTADSIINRLLDELVFKNPEQAAKQSARFGCADQLRDGLGLWTKANPAAAVAWYKEQAGAAAFKDKGLHSYPSVEHEGTKGLMASLFEAAPDAAKSMVETLSPGEAASVLSALAENPDNTKIGDEEIAFMAARLSSSKKAGVSRMRVMRMAGEDRDKAAAFIRSAGLDEKEQTSLLIRTASQGKVEKGNLDERLVWIADQLGPKQAAGAQGEILAQTLTTGSSDPPDGVEAETVFNTAKRLGAANGGNELVARFLDHSSPRVLESRPADYFTLASSLPAGRSRERHLEKAIEAWTARDPAAAASAMTEARVSPKPAAERRGKR